MRRQSSRGMPTQSLRRLTFSLEARDMLRMRRGIPTRDMPSQRRRERLLLFLFASLRLTTSI